MKRAVIVLSTAVLVSACMDSTNATPTKAASGGFPSPFVIAGQSGPGAIAAKELRGAGMAVKTQLSGRAAGITAFCSGKAHAVAMTSDFTSAEWKVCKELGGSWSAFGAGEGTAIYVRHALAEEYLKRRKGNSM